jgi:hypothetical protein
MALALPLQAQNEESTPIGGVSLALRASLSGVGLEAATALSNHIFARAGVDYLGFQSSYYDVALPDKKGKLYDAFGYVPDYHAKGKLQFLNGRLLVDYHPSANGIFHLTAGAYIGSFGAHVDGYLVDHNGQPSVLKEGREWPVIEFDDQTIDMTDGRANLDLQLGNIVKPYIGIGLGRAVTERRLGYKVELGVIYLGPYTLKQDGKSINLGSNTEDVPEIDDAHRILSSIRWMPTLSVQISYRIF